MRTVLHLPVADDHIGLAIQNRLDQHRDTVAGVLVVAVGGDDNVRAGAQAAKSGPGRADNGNFVLSELAASVTVAGSSDSPVEVEFADVRVDHAQPKFPARHAVDGKTDTGWAIGGVDPLNVHRTATFSLKQSIKQAIPGGGPVAWTIKLVQHHGDGHTLGKFRLRFGKEIPDERPLEVRRREHLEEKFGQWLDTEQSKAVAWTLLEPVEASSDVPYLVVEKDHAVFASGDFTKSDIYRVKLRSDLEKITAIRLEALADDRLPNGGPGTVYYEGPAGDFWLSSFHLFVDGHEVEIQSATESFSNGANKAAKALDDDLQSAWSISGGQGRDHSAVFRLTHAITDADHVTVEMLFERYYAAGLGRFRIWGFGRRHRVNDELRRIIVPENDVHAFASQFIGNGLNTRSAHANTGANSINAAVVTAYRYLGAQARIAG